MEGEKGGGERGGSCYVSGHLLPSSELGELVHMENSIRGVQCETTHNTPPAGVHVYEEP